MVKILYITTCDCRITGQSFNAWFFPAFQHLPWSFWWTYHGITWLAGPYSVIWWALNTPAILGYWVFFGYLLVLDFGLTLLLWQKISVFWATVWTLFSVWWVLVDPVDFFPMMMIFLGRYHWGFLPLAIGTKLPFGAPLWVWQWVLTSSNSLHAPENFSRYAILAAFWIISLFFVAKASLQHRLSGNDVHRLDGTTPA